MVRLPCTAGFPTKAESMPLAWFWAKTGCPDSGSHYANSALAGSCVKKSDMTAGLRHVTLARGNKFLWLEITWAEPAPDERFSQLPDPEVRKPDGQRVGACDVDVFHAGEGRTPMPISLLRWTRSKRFASKARPPRLVSHGAAGRRRRSRRPSFPRHRR